MTIADYLQNPYGKGSAISNVTTQKENLVREYNELQTRFVTRIYLYRGEAIFHVVVPSRNRGDQTYDVVLQIHMEDTKDVSINLETTPMLVFSNCPSFIYTYANAFREKGLNIKWLDSKYRREVQRRAATTKNEYGIIGLERSLYLACLHLNRTRRSEVGSVLSTSIKPTSFNAIARLIRSQDQIMASVKSRAQEKKVPEVPSDTPRTAENRNDRNRIGIRKVARVQTGAEPVQKTAKVKGGINKTKSVKKTKRI